MNDYWLFDPAGTQLSTRLVGHQRRAGHPLIAADAAGRLRRQVLGLDLHVRSG